MPTPDFGSKHRQAMINAIIKIKEDFGIDTARSFVEGQTRVGGKILDIPSDRYEAATEAAKTAHAELSAQRDAH